MTQKRKLTDEKGPEETANSQENRAHEDAHWTATAEAGTSGHSEVDNGAHVIEGTSAPSSSEVVQPTGSSEIQTPAKKTVRLSLEDCMKLIELECEWNMCTSKFKKMERFCFHISEHFFAECKADSDSEHVCLWRECGYICSSIEELQRHVHFHGFHTKLKAIGTVLMNHQSRQCVLDASGRNMIPEIPEAFECNWDDCDIKFASAQSFYWHVQSHVMCVDPNDKKQYLCAWDGCTSTFKIQTRLKDHTRSHTQEKLVGCPVCGGIYSNNTKFFDHCIRQIPLSMQQFQCSHCSTKFANERLLRDHVRRHINHFKCAECEMTCPTKSTLLAHIRYRHSTERPHKCPQCGKGFKFLMDVSRHMTVHSEDPAFICPYAGCNFSCRSQSTLNKHIKLKHRGMHEKMYACHICDEKYSWGILVTRHLIRVHNFHWPAGHSKFRYKPDDDGYYRLQTIRYESIELTQEGDDNMQGDDGDEEEEEMVDSPETMSAPPTPASFVSTTSSVPSNAPVMQRDCRSHNISDSDNTDTNLERALQVRRPNSPKLTSFPLILLPSEF